MTHDERAFSLGDIMMPNSYSLSPYHGFVLAHCTDASLGLSFPLPTERPGFNNEQTLLPLTVLDSRFQRPGSFSKEKGHDPVAPMAGLWVWKVTPARTAFHLILSIAL